MDVDTVVDRCVVWHTMMEIVTLAMVVVVVAVVVVQTLMVIFSRL